MSDGFSYTQAEMDAATKAGFADPRQQQAQAKNDEGAAARARWAASDKVENAIVTGAVKAEDVPIEERRARSQVETSVSAKGLIPWMRLPEAKVLEGQMDSLTALRESGLDWKVLTMPLQIIDESVRTDDEVPAVAIVRETDKRVLGASGTSYKAIQNDELFAIGEALVKHGGAKWETAGSLNGGKRVWVLLSLEDSGEIVPGDQVKPYILISNAHDGYRTADIALTTVRVVCNNSYRLAMGGAGAGVFKFKHTTNVQTRLAQAGEILLKANEIFAAFKTQAAAAADLKLGEQAQLDFLVKALEIDADPAKRTGQMRRKLEVATACLREERACAAAGIADSGWTAFNAVTRFTSHEARVMGDPLRADEKRLESSQWGANAAVNQEAFEMILELTQAASAAR